MSASKHSILIVAVIIVTGVGYALGNGHVFNKPATQTVSAPKVATPTPSSTRTTTTTTAASTYSPASTIQGAVDSYLTAKGVTLGTNTITNLQTVGDAARGKLKNGDSGSIFYAHKSDNMWTVVFAGQTTLPQNTVNQYGLPSEWVGQTTW